MLRRPALGVPRVTRSRTIVGGLITVAAALVVNLLPAIGPYQEPIDPGRLALSLTGEALWTACAVAALSRPATVRWGWLVVVFALSELWILGHIPGDFGWTLGWAFQSTSLAVLAHLMVAFPSGKLQGRFDRLVVGWIYVYVLAGGPFRMLFWDTDTAFPCQPPAYCTHNLLLVWPDNELVARYDFATALAVPLVGLPIILAVVRHWRRAKGPARRVLLPVVLGIPVYYGINSVAFIARQLELTDVTAIIDSPLVTATFSVLPVTFLLGILRARWARGGVAELAVQLGAGVPVGGLRDALARTLRDPTLELAFPSPSAEGLVDPEGRAFALPADGAPRVVRRLERDGELLAVLVHDPALSAEDPALVDAVGSVARLALENERLGAQVRAQLEEVRRSRARIVEAADAERRRVERDLHDGAQQRLVALALRLQLAKDTAAGASALLDEATDELQTAIAEVRSLARGIHPPILTEAGLAAAIEALAERASVPVTIDVPAGRYPAAVEAAAYFVVAEALTNVARYAGASGVTVTVRDEGGRLMLTVRDDGRGGADASRGSGLAGLADRVAALGGRLAVTSPAGGGTTVQAELPVW